MAYNLQSLITILEQILNPEQTCDINLLDDNKGQLQSLLQKAYSLQQILERSPLPRAEALEIRIREAVHVAEDIIEARMVDRNLCRSLFRWLITWCGGCFFTVSSPALQQVMQELDSAMAQVEKLVEAEGGKLPPGRGLPSARGTSPSLPDDPSSKSVVAGVSQDLEQLRDRLIGTQSKLEIVPIVGMGGIGKTTLALMLYRDPSILHHFEYRAWATISQDFDMKAVLSSLLCCITGKRIEDLIRKDRDEECDELREIMYKSLFGRRYMIVLDDIWNTAFWDEVRKYFPDTGNGSRIVITTRESEVANHVGSRSLHHRVQLLSESRSWSLLCRIVFGKEDCPDALRGVGKRIACVCSGLPLAVNVMGGLLSKLERSEDVWESIASNASAALQFGEGFSNILSLSYNHLPYHLKPCFLYMGAFPEDYEIKGSLLVRLWIAEGFVKSKNGRLEEEAEEYLKALVERNLLVVKENKCNGDPKSYMIHDLLRDLCTRKADEERFLHVAKNASEVEASLYACDLRRISAYGMSEFDPPRAEFSSRARTFLCSSYYETPPCLFSALRLLRVLDVVKLDFPSFPTDILLLVNLRYLSVSCDSGLPSGISGLRRLRTLIANLRGEPVPFERCELPELRHLEVRSYTMIGIEEGYRVQFCLNKLHTLSVVCVTNSLLRSGFFGSCIPSIALLRIYFKDMPLSTVDLSHLHGLRSLRCEANPRYRCFFRPTIMFPSNLRKLTLNLCVAFGRLLADLCGLPNLEVLKLRKCRFRKEVGAEIGGWEAAEGDEFRSLQVLYLDAVELLVWTADETNFPRLRRLVFKNCSQQLEIPAGIGEIPTLELIDLYRCSGSLIASAERILEVQQSDYGNYDLKLLVSS